MLFDRCEPLSTVKTNFDTILVCNMVVIEMEPNEPNYRDVSEMPDDEFMALRKVALKDRDVNMYGGEFTKSVWRRTYEYRGIKYDIAMLRYLSTQENIGMNQYSRWFVLEHPEETNHIVELAKKVDEDTEFLYKDTLHSWNDDQSLEVMFYEMVDYAKKDIDWFLDNSIEEITTQVMSAKTTQTEVRNIIDKIGLV